MEDLVGVPLGGPAHEVRWGCGCFRAVTWAGEGMMGGSGRKRAIMSTVVLRTRAKGETELHMGDGAGDLGDRNSKSRKEHGRHQKRLQAPTVTAWGLGAGFGWVVVLTAQSNLSELTSFGG